MTQLNSQPSTGGQPHQINRVRQRKRLVEIIDAPHQPTLGIAPGTIIFYMQIANGQHCGCAGHLRTKRREKLHPAIERGAQERKCILRHQLVLGAKITLDHADVTGQPRFILPGRLLDVHGIQKCVPLKFTALQFNQRVKATQMSSPTRAANVTGIPRRAKSQKEILIPISRACWTTMMLDTLPIIIRLPPKLLASARMYGAAGAARFTTLSNSITVAELPIKLDSAAVVKVK